MRHLLHARPHLLAASLCLGLAAANILRDGSLAIVLGAVVVAIAAVGAPPRWRMPVLGVALALAGWWWGSARLDALDRSPLLPHVGTANRALVAVTGPARRSRYDLRVPAQMRRYGDEVIREPVLLRLSPGRSPPQGALLELTGEIRRPRGPSDGFDERTWLRRHGVHVVVHASRWRIVGRRGGLSGFADGLRARLARSMAPGLGGERRAVIAGIVLGEDEGLSESLQDRFRASGLYHLLAVSGQNVALIAGGALLFAYLIGASRVLGEIFALGAIGGYVLAVGWQPSVVRAGIAGALASLAWLAARPRDRWYFLLLGAAVLLAWNPYSLLDAGFQLSFAAVAAIFVVVPRLERSLAGYPLPRSLAEVVAVSAACGVATAPILITQFGTVPLYSIPANALAFPVVAPLLGIALVTALVAPVGAATCRRSRLGQRLAGGIPRRLRASRRRVAVRRSLRPDGARGGCGRAGLRRPHLAPASTARTTSRRADPGRGARRRRLASPFRRFSVAPAERPSHHVPRRRPGRRRAPASPGRGCARGRGPA